MKAILSAAVVLGLCGLVAVANDEKADDKKNDRVGTWKCEYTIGDMKRTAELTVTKGRTRWPPR